MGITDKVKDALRVAAGVSNSVLGIDISASSIKVVQLRKKGGRATLETYGELALGPYAGKEIGQATSLPEEKIIEALQDILHESKTSTKNCGVSIPLSASFLTNISFPEVEENQLKEVIPLEARKYIPVPISEVLLDWYVIPKDSLAKQQENREAEDKQKHATTDALIVAIHKETIAKYQNIIKKSELASSFFEIEIFSLIRAALERGIEPTLVADFGASSTKLFVVKSGIVLASHTINRGSQEVTQAIANALSTDLGEAEQIKRSFDKASTPHSQEILGAVSGVFDQIFFESKQVIGSFEKKHHEKVTRIVFTGGGALFPELKPLAKEEFDVEVVLADPFSKIKTPAFLEDVLRQAGPEFAVAIGVALRKLEEKN